MMTYDETERRLKQIEEEVAEIEKNISNTTKSLTYQQVKKFLVNVTSLKEELSHPLFKQPREYPNTNMYAVPDVEKEHMKNCEKQITKLNDLEKKIKLIQFKIELSDPDYKYGKDKNRFHAFKTETVDEKFINDARNEYGKSNDDIFLEETTGLTGDKLKKRILDNIKNFIERSLNPIHGHERIYQQTMKDITENIKNSKAYEILAKGTGITTRMLHLKTSSLKALDKMIDEAKEQDSLRPKMK